MTGYAAADRVLSISFTRDPEEHAAVMLDAGRRMLSDAGDGLAWGKALGTAIGFGAGVGIVMELYRRFVLPLFFEPEDMAPLGTAAVEILPLLVLMAALCAGLSRRTARRQRRALISRLRPGQVVDVDVFSKGIRMSTEFSAIEYDWLAARDILAVQGGMEIEYEAFAIFIPERAFADRAAFRDAGKRMRALWHGAVKRDHDGKLLAAGLD